jgi:DNA-binding transcriptional ArsR family regulator
MEVQKQMLETFQTELQVYEGNAELLKVLAHPVRLCIVKGLIEKGPSNVSTMYTGLNMPQSTISQHLAKLKSAKIVTSERKGLEIYYNVENEKVIQLIQVLF